MGYLLTFMYIFAFKIYSIIDSSTLIFFILTAFMLINKKYRRIVLDGIRSKYFLYVAICAMCIILWSLYRTIMSGIYDFSYIKTIIHLILTIITGMQLVCYFKYKGKQDKIVNYIVGAFIAQSCIQWIFFLFPNFSNLFNIFRTDSAIASASRYAGYRGIAISSTAFFGLASAYGLVGILYVTKYNTLFKNHIVKFLMFFLMFSGTIFAGRTGIVALPFILIILIVRLVNNREKILSAINKKMVIQLISCILIILVIFIATSSIAKFSKMYSYFFELARNVFSGEGFTTTSTDKLISMYDRDISLKTFLIGDGQYTVIDGENEIYYMNTDAGYYRKIFYFGVIGLILSFILQFLILNCNNKKDWQKILIFVFFTILEIKGEIIGISIIINSIVVLFAYTTEPKIEEGEKNG